MEQNLSLEAYSWSINPKIPAFMEPENLLPRSWEHNPGRHLQSDKVSEQQRILSF
jgi:hypothetical protein